MVRVGSPCIDLRVIALSVKAVPRPRVMNRDAVSDGKPPRSCGPTRPAVGLVVTAQQITDRRAWRLTKSVWRTRSVVASFGPAPRSGLRSRHDPVAESLAFRLGPGDLILWTDHEGGAPAGRRMELNTLWDGRDPARTRW